MNFIRRWFGVKTAAVTRPAGTVTPWSGEDDLWTGPTVSEMDGAVKDPVGLSAKEDMMNATANALGAQSDGLIRFLVRNGRVVGVWVKAFPDNATKKRFLSMYCAIKTENPGGDAGVIGVEDAHTSALAGRFEIYRERNGNGFNVRFL